MKYFRVGQRINMRGREAIVVCTYGGSTVVRYVDSEIKAYRLSAFDNCYQQRIREYYPFELTDDGFFCFMDNSILAQDCFLVHSTINNLLQEAVKGKYLIVSNFRELVTKNDDIHRGQNKVCNS